MKHLVAAETLIKSLVKRRLAKVKKIKGVENTTDLLTNHVSKDVYLKLEKNTGYRQLTDEELKVSPEKMLVINSITTLRSSTDLVAAYESQAFERDRQLALQFANLSLVRDDQSDLKIQVES